MIFYDILRYSMIFFSPENGIYPRPRQHLKRNRRLSVRGLCAIKPSGCCGSGCGGECGGGCGGDCGYSCEDECGLGCGVLLGVVLGVLVGKMLVCHKAL